MAGTEGNEKLYSTAEISLATGMQRGTITNRARALGFVRNGFGYTAEQVMQIMLQPMVLHRKNEEKAVELRDRLNEMIVEDNIPVAIVQNKNGEWKMEYNGVPVRGAGRKIIPKGAKQE